MSTRDEMDALCWRTMHDRPVPKTEPTAPCNYADLGMAMLRGDEWEDAFYSFNCNFARHRTASFFEFPPPDWIEREYQAFLAGVAEFYSVEFNLPIPDWVNDPKYILPEPWEPWGWMLSPDVGAIERRIAKAHPCFIARNVVYEARGLIVI
jgi:hypothetical protein